MPRYRKTHKYIFLGQQDTFFNYLFRIEILIELISFPGSFIGNSFSLPHFPVVLMSPFHLCISYVIGEIQTMQVSVTPNHLFGIRIHVPTTNERAETQIKHQALISQID